MVEMFPIDTASPSLCMLVAIDLGQDASDLLGLSRDCLTFEMFLMDVFMRDHHLRTA